jgi:hypothetical protein
VSRDGTERTWRLPVGVRIARVVLLPLFLALPALWLALTLSTNQVPNAGWIALAVALPFWGAFAWRMLAQGLTLTPGMLVIRNVLTTKQVPLATITGVGFRGGLLRVTVGHGGTVGERHTVSAVNLGTSRWSGVRGDADAVAEVIAAAAGLPQPPPRREIVSRNWAWTAFLAAALCFGAGLYLGPLQAGSTGVPFALREVGAALYVVGTGTLGLAFRLTRDHRRKRRVADARGSVSG